jgi:hypothetical protein
MISIVRFIGPVLFSTAGRFGIVIVFVAFNRYGRRLWRWFWA